MPQLVNMCCLRAVSGRLRVWRCFPRAVCNRNRCRARCGVGEGRSRWSLGELGSVGALLWPLCGASGARGFWTWVSRHGAGDGFCRGWSWWWRPSLHQLGLVTVFCAVLLGMRQAIPLPLPLPLFSQLASWMWLGCFLLQQMMI